MSLEKKSLMSINNRLFSVFCLLVGFAAFFSTLYRAATTSIAYDEAYTYLTYVRAMGERPILDIIKDSIANNHLLNSFLIKAVEMVTGNKFDELTIRLPNLFFYPFFLFFAYLIALSKTERFAMFALLSLNYYMHEYFGIARGYAMAATLALIALYFLESARQDLLQNKFGGILASIGFFTLAGFANTISLLILASIAVPVIIYLFQGQTLGNFIKKHYLLLFVYSVANGFLLYYHMLISLPGKPLTSSELGFYESILMGYPLMYFSNGSFRWLTSILICVLLFGAVLVSKKKITDHLYIISFLIFLFLNWIMGPVFGKGYPTLRVLIPAFPLLILAIYQSFSLIKENIQKRTSAKVISFTMKALEFLLVVGLVVIFFRKYDLTSARDIRGHHYPIKDIAFRTLVADVQVNPAAIEEWTAERVFYVEKFIYLYDEDIRTYPIPNK